MTIRALLSRSDGSDELVDLAAWNAHKIPRNELLWIDAQAPSDDERALVERALSLDTVTLEALEATAESPDARVLDDGILVTVQTLASDLAAPAIGLHVLIGHEWAVTWHADRIAFLDEQHARIQDQREVGRLTPVQLLVSMLDWHLATFFTAAEELEHQVDHLDDLALGGTEENMLEQLVEMRRRISRVRRLLSVHRDMYSEVARPGFLPELDPRESEALAAVNHRFERATEAVANAREMLLGTFDVHMTRTAQRTNDIMRLLTWVSVTLLPAGVLAGVMGMNFQVGFFNNSDLFWIVVASMIVVGLTTLSIARWRGWL
jgi:Mg2+ and Co2+ transporter CorA